MDWTAAAFGLMVTLVGALFTGVVLLIRRELDHHRTTTANLDDRLRRLESDHVFLQPLALVLKHKADEGAAQLARHQGD